MISYNLNGGHVEGATDFLWMVILSILKVAGADPYLSSTILSMIALVGTAWIFFRITKTQNVSYFIFYIFFLTLLPTTPASIQGFSPLVFGFFIVLSAYFLIERKLNKLLIALLVLCLIRPDGIVIAGPLIVSFLILNKGNFRNDIVNIIKYFIIPGILYFAWRWNYFGEFLPLPFYVKSSFDRFLFLFNLDSLKENVIVVIMFFLPTIIFIARVLYLNKTPKVIIALLIATFFIPFVFYSSMMLSQNVSFRFQYPMILSMLIILSGILHKYKNKKILLFWVTAQVLFLIPVTANNFLLLLRIPNEQGTYIAKGLNEITTKGRMLVTEAGRLPYYSKWDAVDAWGLNTPKFSKKLIQPDDIHEYKPDLIVMHADYSFLSNIEDIPVQSERTWQNMGSNIAKGINMEKYQLLMLPYTTDNVKGPFSTITDIIYNMRESVRKMVKKTDRYKRYDAYFVRNDYNYANEVKQLLLNRDAISFEQYLIMKNIK